MAEHTVAASLTSLPFTKATNADGAALKRRQPNRATTAIRPRRASYDHQQRRADPVTVPARFTKADVRRAIKSVEESGLPVGAVKVEPDGSITVLVGTEQNNDDWRAGSPLYRAA